MKIIARDNFDRDYVSERVVAENLDLKEARTRCTMMNNNEGSDSQWFYVVKPDDYTHYKFEP